MVTKVVKTPNTTNDLHVLVWMLLALGLTTLALSFVLKRRFLANAINMQRPEMVQTALIVAWALCEVTALFGLVVFFVTGSSAYYIFFIFGALGVLLHFPRRNDLLAATFKDGGQGFTMR
jgi:F0F1-type ATP synthase membrane subunit c/vacuolar-type H+-ATPase subunit K